MHFTKEILKAQRELMSKGHEVLVPLFTKECIDTPEMNCNYELNAEHDFLMVHFNKISESDAILVINNRRHDVDGYIGGATLMEIGLAKFLNKQIFILNELPSKEKIGYMFEIKLIKPVILKGDLNKIDD